MTDSPNCTRKGMSLRRRLQVDEIDLGTPGDGRWPRPGSRGDGERDNDARGDFQTRCDHPCTPKHEPDARERSRAFHQASVRYCRPGRTGASAGTATAVIRGNAVFDQPAGDPLTAPSAPSPCLAILDRVEAAARSAGERGGSRLFFRIGKEGSGIVNGKCKKNDMGRRRGTRCSPVFVFRLATSTIQCGVAVGKTRRGDGVRVR